MKLNQDFIFHSVGDETVLVPTGDASFHGLIRGNKTLHAILTCLEKETTEEEMLCSLKEKYDGDEAAIRSDLNNVLSQLRSIGAIDE